MGSHSRFNTEYGGAASTGSVPMENPQWHIKGLYLFARLQPLAPHGAFFVLSEQENHQICPMNATQDAKLTKFCDGLAVPHPPFWPTFFNRSLSFFPPFRRYPEVIFLKNGKTCNKNIKC